MQELLTTKDLNDVAHKLHEEGNRQVYIVLNTGEKIKKRLGRTSHNEMLIMKSRTRGSYLRDYLSNVVDIVPIKVDRKKLWEKSLSRGIAMLEESGLWIDLRGNMELALSIGYDRLQQCYELSQGNFESDYTKNCEERVKRIKGIDARLVKMGEGKEYYITEILWYMVNPLKIKKMNFGKYRNEQCFKEIAEAMINKKEIDLRGDNGYDVSFNYSPSGKDGKERAWYSEEYRGCGNGHYFLALNGTHAMFYEDD